MLTIGHFTVDKKVMIRILPERLDSLVCIKVSGKLTDAEYQNFIPRVEAIIKKFGIIKILDLDGWEWRMAWDDFAFGIQHWDKFSKIGIVGEKRWAQTSAWITNKIAGGEVRFCRGDETTEAFSWVKH